MTQRARHHIWVLGAIGFLVAVGLFAFSLLRAANPYELEQGLGQPLFGTFNAFSGDPNLNPAGATSAIGVSGPRDSAIDPTGNRLFIADRGNNRVIVHQLDASNELIDHVADFVLGQNDFLGNDSDLNAAALNGPEGIAFDDLNDRLFVADPGNFRVVVFDLSLGITNGMDASWVLGQDDLDDSVSEEVSDSRINENIEGLAYDALGQRLFVSDSSSNRVIVFDVTGVITNGEPAVAVIGQDDFDSSDDSGVTATTFSRPRGLAYDPTGSRLFVADVDNTISFGNRILVFDASIANLASEGNGDVDGISPNAENVLGQPDFVTNNTPPFTPNSQQMTFPYALTIDADGPQRLFVADFYDYRVLVFDIDTIVDYEAAAAVLGQDTFASVDFETTQDSIQPPRGLGYDPLADRLYASDDVPRVMIFDVSSITNGEDAVDMLGQIDYSDNPDYAAFGANNLMYPPTGPQADNMNAPMGVAIDETNHRLYAADSVNNRVLVYDLEPDQTIDDITADVVLGQPDFISDDPGAGQASLSEPYEVVLDVAGDRLFVSDRGNNRVLVFDTSGLADGQAADRVLGQLAFGTNVAASGPTGMDTPAGLAYSPTTNTLYVTDTGNNRVLAFDVGTTVADITNGQAAEAVLGQDTLLTGGSATSVDGLSDPDRLALDDAGGRLFVSDTTNNRVMVFDVAVVASGEDAIAVIGQSNFTSAATAVTVDGLTAPAGMAYDSDRGYLFVGDTGSFRTMIYDTVALASVSQDATAVLGQMDLTSNVDPTGVPGSSNELTPSGLAFDVTTARVYMADSGFHRVVSYELVRMDSDLPDGVLGVDYDEDLGVTGVQTDDTYSVVSGTLPPGLVAEDGTLSGTPTTPGTFIFTLRVHDIDGWGELTYDQSHTITIDAETTAYNSAALLGSTNDDLGPYYGAGEPYDTPNHIGFDLPNGSAIDTVGHRLFVAEVLNNRVLVFNLTAGNLLDDRHADYVLGQPDFKSNDDTLTQHGFNNPSAVAYDESDERLFVSDYLNYRVLVFDLSGGIANGMDASWVLGQPDFETADPALDQDSFLTPSALAYDNDNDRLFVGGTSRVTIFDATGLANGQLAVGEIGQADFVAQDFTIDAHTIDAANGLAYDSSTDRLFVSDYSRNRVLVFDLDDGIDDDLTDGEDAIHVLGQADDGDPFDSDDADTTQSGLDAPAGLAHTSDQRLFVADINNNRVMVFDADPGTIADGELADNVLGQPNFTSTDGGATQAEFDLQFLSQPTFDATTNRLYVPDGGNYRIMVFDAAIIANGEPAVDEVGHLGADGEVRYDTSQQNDEPNNRGFDFTPYYGGCAALDVVHHRMFVCSGKRVHVLDLDANNEPLDALADNVLGASDFYIETSGITALSMIGPSDLAYDPVNDRLFVADYDASRVFVYDVATITDGEAPTNVLGQEDFTSDVESTADDGMRAPGAIALDSSTQRLFVADDFADRLQVFDVDPAVLIPNVIQGPDAINIVDGVGDTTTTQTTFWLSSGLAGSAGLVVDESRQLLFLNDSAHSRIMIIPVDTATLVPNVTDSISAVGVLGQPDFDTWGDGVSQTQIGYGGGELVYDSTTETVFLADYDNLRLLGFDVTDETSIGIPASFVIGQRDFTTTLGGSASESAGVPDDIMFDNVRRRLLATRANAHSIIAYDLVRIPSQSFPTLTTGVPANEDIITENDQGTVTFELISGTLPPGLVLSSLTGTPTTPGTYTFTVQANDDNGPIGAPYDQQTLTVTVAQGTGGSGGGGGFIPTPTPTPGSTPTPTAGATPTPAVSPGSTPVGSPGSTPGASPTFSPIAGVSPGTSPGPTSPGTSPSVGPGLPSVINRVLGNDALARVIAASSRLIAVLSIGAILLSAILLSRNLADLVALGAFALQSMLIVLGIKKRARVWGTVYDSGTKHPVQFAKIELSDTTGRVLETRFADRDGRYGFLTNPEQLHQQTLTVRLKASAAGYLFPSVRVAAGATDFLVYEHVYMGEALTIAADSFLHYDIPMDRQLWRTPRFSEFLPLKSAGGFMSHLMNILFWVGLVLVPWAYWQDPSTLNLIILIVFIGVHALRMLTGMYRPFGVVRDSATRKPVPYALVTLNDVTGVRRSFAVSDDQGRYFVSSEGGTYELQAHTPANVTPQRKQSTTVTTQSGWIRRRLDL